MALLLIVRSFLLDLINQDLKVRSIANRIEVAFRSQKSSGCRNPPLIASLNTSIARLPYRCRRSLSMLLNFATSIGLINPVLAPMSGMQRARLHARLYPLGGSSSGILS